MKKKLLIAIIALFSLNLAFAQKAEVNGIKRKDFRKIQSITNQSTEEVVGYYMLYTNKNKSRKIREFVIDIFGTDLKLKKHLPIEITKHSNIDGTTFNGENFLFVFNDWRKKTLSYVCVSKDGEVLATKGIKEEKLYASTADVYPAPDGFYIVKPVKEKRWGYSIEKVDYKLAKVWENRFLVDKGVISVSSIETFKDRIALVDVRRQTLMTSKQDLTIRNLSGKDGKETFNFALTDGSNTFYPSSILIDENNNLAASGMYEDGKRMSSFNSDGIFFVKLSPTGEKLSVKTYSWDDGIQKIIKGGTKKGISISSKPKVFFHNITMDKKGNYQVLGETFRKSMRLISQPLLDVIFGVHSIGYPRDNDKGSVTFEVMDFITFNFDNTGSMSNINMTQKEHTKIACYYPYNNMGGMALAFAIEDLGLFDYAFTAKEKSSDADMIVANMTQCKAPRVSMFTNEVGKIANERSIVLDKKMLRKTRFYILKGPSGKIAFGNYNRKLKKATIYYEAVK